LTSLQSIAAAWQEVRGTLESPKPQTMETGPKLQPTSTTGTDELTREADRNQPPGTISF